MCLAIAARPGVVVPDEHILAGCRSQRDGYGFAYCDTKSSRVVVEKGFFDPQEFLLQYKKAQAANPESHFLIHMRSSTGGGRSSENTHPFAGKYGAFIHNGVFPNLGKDRMSDTHHLAKLIHDAPSRALPYLLPELRKKLGFNKVVFLTTENELMFLNENSGHWLNKVWYSNKAYETGVTYLGDRPASRGVCDI